MFHNISQSLLLNHVRGNPPEAHHPCPKKTVAMIILADKVCKHFFGLLGELVCPHSIDCFLVSQVTCFTQVSSPVTIDREVSHHLSRRPREMSKMLPCAVFGGLLTRVSVRIWHKIYGSLAFPSQSHATNFVKFEETQARTP